MINRIFLKESDVSYKNNLMCIEREKLKIKGGLPKKLYICFKGDYTEEYINYDFEKKQIDGMLYKSKILGKELLIQ